jgi:hypothetical protein
VRAGPPPQGSVSTTYSLGVALVNARRVVAAALVPLR